MIGVAHCVGGLWTLVEVGGGRVGERESRELLFEFGVNTGVHVESRAVPPSARVLGLVNEPTQLADLLVGTAAQNVVVTEFREIFESGIGHLRDAHHWRGGGSHK